MWWRLEMLLLFIQADFGMKWKSSFEIVAPLLYTHTKHSESVMAVIMWLNLDEVSYLSDFSSGWQPGTSWNIDEVPSRRVKRTLETAKIDGVLQRQTTNTRRQVVNWNLSFSILLSSKLTSTLANTCLSHSQPQCLFTLKLYTKKIWRYPPIFHSWMRNVVHYPRRCSRTPSRPM